MADHSGRTSTDAERGEQASAAPERSTESRPGAWQLGRVGGWFDRRSRRQRLVFVYAVGVSALVLAYTFVYNYGMRTLEGHEHSLFRSFQTVVETMTTTGYGADSPWETPAMNTFVVLMQLSGVGIGIATLRVLIIPLWKRTPVSLDERLTPKEDHVVICEYRRDSDALLDELERLGIEYVLVDGDPDEAKELSDQGYQAITGDAEQRETLERASIGDANVVVADAGERNVSVVLAARAANPDVRLVALTDDVSQRRALERVGVDRVLSPNAVVGRRLAQKVRVPVATADGLAGPDGASTDDAEFEGVWIGGDVLLTELLIRRQSPLHGRPLGETSVGSHPDIDVVAGWFDGELRFRPDPATRLAPNTVLAVVGPRSAIATVRGDVSGLRRPRRHSTVVVAGAGEGGRAAAAVLDDHATVTTVDSDPGQSPDVVGDVAEAETLTAAGIEDATALVVTVADDATALLAIALARSLTDDLEIFARITATERVASAFAAGADYVLSVQRVSARLLARELYGEDVLTPVGGIRAVRVDAAPFEGATLGEAETRDDTGSLFLGVARDDAFLTDEDTRIREGDELVVAGPDAAIQAFEREHE